MSRAAVVFARTQDSGEWTRARSTTISPYAGTISLNYKITGLGGESRRGGTALRARTLRGTLLRGDLFLSGARAREALMAP